MNSTIRNVYCCYLGIFILTAATVDTVLHNNQILRVFPSDDFTVLMLKNNEIKIVDTIGNTLITLSNDVEILDEALPLANKSQIILLKNRYWSSFHWDWQAFWKRMRSLFGLKSSVEIISLNNGEIIHQYSFQGNVLSADIDYLSNFLVLLVHFEGDNRVELIDLESESLYKMIPVDNDVIRIFLDSILVYAVSSNAIFTYRADSSDESRFSLVNRYTTSFLPFQIFSNNRESKEVIIYDDKVADTFGIIRIVRKENICRQFGDLRIKHAREHMNFQQIPTEQVVIAHFENTVMLVDFIKGKIDVYDIRNCAGTVQAENVYRLGSSSWLTISSQKGTPGMKALLIRDITKCWQKQEIESWEKQGFIKR